MVALTPKFEKKYTKKSFKSCCFCLDISRQEDHR